MGEALLSGLLDAGRPAKDLVVAEKFPEKAQQLAAKYPVLVTGVAAAIENAAVVIVAVKPTDVDAVIAEFAKVVAASDGAVEPVLVSIAAGVTIGHIEAKLPAGGPVIRVMPNTPAQVGAGASALAAGSHVSAEQLAEVVELFRCVGYATVVPEEQIDAVTGVSGSGPAYFFLAVEALIDAGVSAGLSRPVATELAVQTMAGSAQMLADRVFPDGPGAGSAVGRFDTSPAQLRAEVTSPGGTTAAALAALERNGLRTAFAAAVRAAADRAGQLRITSE